MPKKKTPPPAENPWETSPVAAPPEIRAAGKTEGLIEQAQEIEKVNEAPARFFSHTGTVVFVSALGGFLLGILLTFFILVKPAQDQLATHINLQQDGAASSNQIRSDLTNMSLRQQEMEIRYLTAAARLESANQYILLLRMKNCVSEAQLLVEQKNGLEARKMLADLRTLYDQLYPYIIKKDAAVADELDAMIKTTTQDLTSDPQTAAADLTDMAEHLQKVEAALFHVE